MNLHIANLKTAAHNPTLPEEKRQSARNQLQTIAGNPTDPRAKDAALVLRELDLTGDEDSTENGRDSSTENGQRDSEEFAVCSATIRTQVWMAMADEAATKAGNEPFDYRDSNVRDECHAMFEAWKRARTVPMFWDWFNDHLTQHCKDLMGFNFPRPSGETHA